MNSTDNGSANSAREHPASAVAERSRRTPTTLTVDGTANELVMPIPKKTTTAVQEAHTQDQGLASDVNVTDDGSAHPSREQSQTGVEDPNVHRVKFEVQLSHD
jgi:hypothetical protein